ncbi:Probable N-acetyltransferase CML2 [Seminavis robusta]|uniref:Probable N-acetyltransferase CML2 n=1 Tax=Seminavis robusta TaxID=568900 RepID=A0A9N8E4A1_9STRA|nr:Probable N-acetyltransferase CML2 [Seminavis robusta]|eukprot:Sro649_g181290.1 Probable N-acetyltransferase CML2 (231) ;mRNA; f:46153-46845
MQGMCRKQYASSDTNRSDILIRHYRSQDEQRVKEIFSAGMLSLVPDAFLMICTKPVNVGVMATVGFIVAWLSKSVFATAMTEGVMMGLLYMFLRTAFGGYVSSSIQDDLSNIPKFYVENGGCFLVATDSSSGKIAGMVGAEPKGDNQFELRRMSVDQECQGRGVGRQLLRRLYQECKGAKILLTTSNIQHTAQRLYRNNGFVVKSKFPIFKEGWQAYLISIEINSFEIQL